MKNDGCSIIHTVVKVELCFLGSPKKKQTTRRVTRGDSPNVYSALSLHVTCYDLCEVNVNIFISRKRFVT